MGFDAIAQNRLQTRRLRLGSLPKGLGHGFHSQETEARECSTIMMVSLARKLLSDGPHWQARIPLLVNIEQRAIGHGKKRQVDDTPSTTLN